MIIQKQIESTVLETGDSQESIKMSLDLDSAQILMQMLSKNLYSDSIGSTIRECASNALDSHRRLGVNEPIIVSFKITETRTYEFSVEDFGLGMDDDDVTNIISKYGKSTKRESNIEIGAMGLGFKSPLSYSSSFYFVCRKNGIERKYMMYETEDANNIDLLHESETTERNGVKIIVPVNYSDRHEFVNKIREQLCYFENVYFDVLYGEELNNNFTIYRDEHYQFSEIYTGKRLHICLDDVYYPIDFDKLNISIINFPVALRFSLSDGIYPTPNRESLRYTKEAKKLILDKIALVSDYFTSNYNEKIKSTTSDIFSVLSHYRNAERLVNIHKNSEVEWNINELIKYGSVAIENPSIEGIDLLNIEDLYRWTRDYWLYEYENRFKVTSDKISSTSKQGNYKFTIGRLADNDVRVYTYDNSKLSILKKDYLKSIVGRNQFCIVRKTKKMYLKSKDFNNYTQILSLKKHPKSEWRQRIKQFQHLISLITANFIDLDNLDIPKEFIDANKKQVIKFSPADISISSDAKKINLSGHITGNEACGLLKYVYDKNCKWVVNNYEVANIHKNKYLSVYGCLDDVLAMDKLYPLFNFSNIRFLYFSERQLVNVNKLKIHNLITLEEFMKGDTQLFRKAATSYLINKLKLANKDVFESMHVDKISKSLRDKISLLNEYRDRNHRNADSHLYKIIADVAVANNLYDMSIYHVYSEINDILTKLPFLQVLLNKNRGYESNDGIISCIIDLCKYHKFKVNLDRYKIVLTEDEVLDEVLTEETIEFLQD